MPDITMCQGKGQVIASGQMIPKSTAEEIDCPKKETCYRYKAKPSEFRQAYFVGIPYEPSTDNCKHFLTISENLKARLEQEPHDPTSGSGSGQSTSSE